MNDQQIESEIQSKGMTAPRVTPQDIEANIASEHYFTALDGVTESAADAEPCVDGYEDVTRSFIKSDTNLIEVSKSLSLLTFCVIVLRNGFTVTGESACASPENFDAELGRKIARQNAVNKIWPLMGYALKQRLHDSAS